MKEIEMIEKEIEGSVEGNDIIVASESKMDQNEDGEINDKKGNEEVESEEKEEEKVEVEKMETKDSVEEDTQNLVKDVSTVNDVKECENEESIAEIQNEELVSEISAQKEVSDSKLELPSNSDQLLDTVEESVTLADTTDSVQNIDINIESEVEKEVEPAVAPSVYVQSASIEEVVVIEAEEIDKNDVSESAQVQDPSLLQSEVNVDSGIKVQDHIQDNSGIKIQGLESDDVKTDVEVEKEMKNEEDEVHDLNESSASVNDVVLVAEKETTETFIEKVICHNKEEESTLNTIENTVEKEVEKEVENEMSSNAGTVDTVFGFRQEQFENEFEFQSQPNPMNRKSLTNALPDFASKPLICTYENPLKSVKNITALDIVTPIVPQSVVTNSVPVETNFNSNPLFLDEKMSMPFQHEHQEEKGSEDSDDTWNVDLLASSPLPVKVSKSKYLF